MGYGAKRLAEIEAERKARREEKARIKKEKEEEKQAEEARYLNIKNVNV